MPNLYPLITAQMETPVVTDVDDKVINLSEQVMHVCVCGSSWWNLQVTFHEYEVGSYLTDMCCANCGFLAKAPTALDDPDFIEWRKHTPDHIPNAEFRK